MKRIGTLALSVVAAFALSVMLAASAQATKPSKGLVPLHSVGAGEAILGNPVVNIKCTSHESTGEENSAKGGTAVATYRHCEAEGISGGGCENTLGKTATGESNSIQTAELKDELGWAPGKTEAAVVFWPAAESKPAAPKAGTATLATFTCGGGVGVVKVFGSVIGKVPNLDVNVMTESGSLRFSNTGLPEFAQEPTFFDGGSAGENVLETEFETFAVPGHPAGERVHSGQTQEDLITNNKNQACKKVGTPKEKCKPDFAEVNTLTGAKPEYGRCQKKGLGLVTPKYSDPNCTGLTPEGKKAKYGWVPLGTPGS
jgi:hypothetical protein